MRQAGSINPGHVIEIDCIDHQRISFPPAHGMAHPPWIFVFRMLAAFVSVDLADKVVEFIEEVDYTRNLHDFCRKWMDPNARHAGWRAANLLSRSRVHRISRIRSSERSP